MFYHGSNALLPINEKIKKEVKGYTNASSVSELEAFMEKHKPINCISRLDCLYVSRDIDLIDCSGGYTDIIYKVELNNYEESDLAWYTEVEELLELGDRKGAKIAALNYWKGVVYRKKEYSCIEIRTKCFEIKEIVELNIEKNKLQPYILNKE